MNGTQMSLDFYPHQRPAYVFENPPRPGELYRYPGHEKVFVVESVGRFSVRFECGHWCTDTVFRDLVKICQQPTPGTIGMLYADSSIGEVANGDQ